MTRFWDGRTDKRSDCTPRPAFAFGDAGKKLSMKSKLLYMYWLIHALIKYPVISK